MSGKCILAVGAHPDDIEFGCGGILLKEVQEGAVVHLRLATRGESGTSGSTDVRQHEALAAAALLGAEKNLGYVNLGTDAHLEVKNAHAIRWAREIRRVRPHILLAPLPDENQHPDHSVVGRLVRDAARIARYGGVTELLDETPHSVDALYFYAVAPSWERKPGDALLVDISDVVEKWKALMDCHASQGGVRPYVELQLARARMLGLMAGVEYAQAVYPNDPPLLNSLSEVGKTARRF